MEAFLMDYLMGGYSGLVVSAVHSGLSGAGSSSPGLGHCVVFFGKTLYCHIAYILPRCIKLWVPEVDVRGYLFLFTY